jgi:molecular chaperone DnaK
MPVTRPTVLVHATRKKAITEDVGDKVTAEENRHRSRHQGCGRSHQGQRQGRHRCQVEALSQASMPLMQKAYAEQAQAAGGADAGARASRY